MLALESLFLISCFWFFFTALFYTLVTVSDPGYVPRATDFIKLLGKLVKFNFHMDYICVYCENLRPENADHCNYCNRCVQKFDHHCLFVDNCLGYKNHKYFLLFLLSLSFFIVSLVTYCAVSIVAFAVYFPSS